MTKVNRSYGNETNSDIFSWDIYKSDAVSFLSKKVKYLNYFQNRNFLALWLKQTQTVEMKQNQTFAHRTYSNLTSYILLSEKNKVFKWLLKSKFLSFMNEVNPNDGNETKSDIFSCDIFKRDIIFHRLQNTKMFQWLP